MGVSERHPGPGGCGERLKGIAQQVETVSTYRGTFPGIFISRLYTYAPSTKALALCYYFHDRIRPTAAQNHSCGERGRSASTAGEVCVHVARARRIHERT